MAAFEVSFGAEPYEEQQSPSPSTSPVDNPFDNQSIRHHPSITRYRSQSIGLGSNPLNGNGIGGPRSPTSQNKAQGQGQGEKGYKGGKGLETTLSGRSIREEINGRALNSTSSPTTNPALDTPYESGLGENISGLQGGENIFRTTSPTSPTLSTGTSGKLKPTYSMRRSTSNYSPPPLFPYASPTSAHSGQGQELQIQNQPNSPTANETSADGTSNSLTLSGPLIFSQPLSDPSNPPPAWTRRTTVKRTPGGHSSGSGSIDGTEIRTQGLSPLLPPPTLPISSHQTSVPSSSSSSSGVPNRRRSGVANTGGVRSRTGSAGSAVSLQSTGSVSGYRRPVGLAGLQMTSSSESRTTAGSSSADTGESDLFDVQPNPALRTTMTGTGVSTPASSTTSLRSPSASREQLGPYPNASRHSMTIKPGMILTSHASPTSSGMDIYTGAPPILSPNGNGRVEYVSEPGAEGDTTPTRSGTGEVPDLSNPFRQSYERPLDTVRRLSRHVDDGMAVGYGGTNDVIWPEGMPVPQSRPPRARSSISLSSKAGNKSARNSIHASQSTPTSPLPTTRQNQSYSGLKGSKSSSASLAAMSIMPSGGIEDFTRELYSSLLPREGGYALAANIGGHGSGNLPKRESVIERGRGQSGEGPDVMANYRRQSNIYRQSNDWTNADISGYNSVNASGPSLPLQMASTNTSSSSLPSLLQAGPGPLVTNTSPAALAKTPSPLSQNVSANEFGKMPEEDDGGLQMRRRTLGGMIKRRSSAAVVPAQITAASLAAKPTSTAPSIGPPTKKTKKEYETEQKVKRAEAERLVKKRADDEKERKRVNSEAEKEKKRKDKADKEGAKLRKKEEERRAKEQAKASRRSSTLVKSKPMVTTAAAAPPPSIEMPAPTVPMTGLGTSSGGSPLDMPATPLKGKTVPIAVTPSSVPTTPESTGQPVKADGASRESYSEGRQDAIGNLLKPALANAAAAQALQPTEAPKAVPAMSLPPNAELSRSTRPETPQRKSSIWGSLRKKFSSGPTTSPQSVTSVSRATKPSAQEVLAPIAPISILPEGYGAPPSRPTSIHQGRTRSPSIHDQGLLLSTTHSNGSQDMGYAAEAIRGELPAGSDASEDRPMTRSSSATGQQSGQTGQQSLHRTSSGTSLSSAGAKRHTSVSRCPTNNHKTPSGPRARPQSMIMGSYDDFARPPSSWNGPQAESARDAQAYDVALPISRQTSRASSGGYAQGIPA